ncbi:hypothetical protein NMY22_g7087 [Coprinellus aureogranulatus]|nr:hypothetical protein NMY22_g7087 [Coprinellus aureogranulatus]
MKKKLKKEKKQAGMTEEEKAAEKQRKLKKLLEKAERKRRDLERRKQELDSMGPVECHICAGKFPTPAAYAQHLESGTHPQIQRHHVTQAVHMLDVIPPITLLPTIQSFSSTGTEGNIASTLTPRSASSSSFEEIDEAGSPVSEADSLTRHWEIVSSVQSVISGTDGSHPASPFLPPFPSPITYTTNDFLHLGIPYACALCHKTFRTVGRLTEHMNSPVHDPAAFKCPGPKCGQEFALVSGLIQHLQSGRCNLASAGEIFERFALLTAKFSRYLTA